METMKKKFKKNLIVYFTAIPLLIMMVFFISSCKKDDTEKTAEQSITTDEAVDESFAAEIFDETMEISDEAVEYTESGSKSTEGYKFVRLGDCVTITRTVSGDTIYTEVDFGEENCLCNDNRVRRGKILITHVGKYWDGAVYIHMTFDNYFVNDNQVLGESTVNGYINEENNRECQINAWGSIILEEDEGTIAWEAQRVREVVEGSETREKYDDVIEVTGSSNGTCANGNTFVAATQTPLVRINEVGCHRFFVSGINKIVKNEETEIFIDYGDGTCDNLATVTIDGVSKVIELKKHRRF